MGESTLSDEQISLIGTGILLYIGAWTVARQFVQSNFCTPYVYVDAFDCANLLAYMIAGTGNVIMDIMGVVLLHISAVYAVGIGIVLLCAFSRYVEALSNTVLPEDVSRRSDSE